MSNNLPLNGERLLNHLEGSLRKSPAVSLAEVLGGGSSLLTMLQTAPTVL